VREVDLRDVKVVDVEAVEALSTTKTGKNALACYMNHRSDENDNESDVTKCHSRAYKLQRSRSV
jgi:hypothetical protein